MSHKGFPPAGGAEYLLTPATSLLRDAEALLSDAQSLLKDVRYLLTDAEVLLNVARPLLKDAKALLANAQRMLMAAYCLLAMHNLSCIGTGLTTGPPCNILRPKLSKCDLKTLVPISLRGSAR